MHAVARPLPIARHIAENYGLAGRNDIESAYAYLVVGHCLDFIKEDIFPLYLDKGSRLKENMKREKLPQFLKEMGEVFDYQ